MHTFSLKIKKAFISLIIGLVFIISFSQIFTNTAQAAIGINRQINFQGKLVNNPSSTNVTDTSYSVIFTFYDRDSGGTVLWQETQSVTTVDGIFRVALGSVTPFPANFNFNWSGLYLGIKVNADSEMTPRIAMAAVPFAFNSEKVAGLTVQDTSGNASTSGTLQIANAKTFNLGNNNLTFTTSGDTTLTLPTTGTVCTTISCLVSDPYWNLLSGSLFPNNSTADFIFGSQASTSATFHLYGSSSGGTSPVASIAGRTSFAAFVIDQSGLGDVFTASTAGITRFTIQKNGFVSLGQAGIANGGLFFNSTGAGISAPSIMTNSLGDLILSAPQANATVQIGSGNGNIGLSLSNVTDFLIADKTYTAGGSYSGSDFQFKRVITGGANALTGAVLSVTDISSGTTTIAPDLILGNAAPTSGTYTGNLLRLQVNGQDRFVVGSTGTQPVASISGKTSYAAFVTNNDGVGDLFTASASGTNKFVIKGNGSIVAPTYQTCTLKTDTNGLFTCGSDNTGSGSYSPFQELAGAIVPNNSTLDFFIGGQSSTSAKFAVLNIAGGTPTATVAGNFVIMPYTFGANELGGTLAVNKTTALAGVDIKDTKSKATVSSEKITATADRDFSSDTGNWTANVNPENWAIYSGTLNKSASGATPVILSNSALDSAPVAGSMYRISFSYSTTASSSGYLTPSFGGTNGNVVGQSVFESNDMVSYIIAVNSNPLTFTPSSASWYGTLDGISVKQIFPSSIALRLESSDGTSSPIEFRTGGTNNNNLFIGFSSGQSFLSGPASNTGIGSMALSKIESGYRNTAVGNGALQNTVTGIGNNAFGYYALFSNISGIGNSAFGNSALQNTAGQNNSGFGYDALSSNSRGNHNSAFGVSALSNSVLGSYNSAFGYQAGQTNTVGGSNILFGYKANVGSGNLINAGAIGANAYVNQSDSLILGSINGINSATGSARIGIGTIAPAVTLDVRGFTTLNAGTLAVASVSGKTSFAALIANNDGVGDLFTASSSGTNKFSVQSNGMLLAPTYNTCTLKTDTNGLFTCGSDNTGSGVNWWNQLDGALSPVSINDDFLIGGTATSTAKFSYTGIQSGQTIASVSGNLIVMPNNGWGGIVEIGSATQFNKVAKVNIVQEMASSPVTTGAEKITDANDRGFTTDTGKWTTSDSPPWSIDIANSNLAAKDAPGTGAITLDNSALDSAPVAGETYAIQYTYTTTASSSGSLLINFGGQNGIPFATTPSTNSTTDTQYITGVNTNALKFTPTIGWFGTLDSISVMQVTASSIPALSLYPSNNNSYGVEFRAPSGANIGMFIGYQAGKFQGGLNGYDLAVGPYAGANLTSGTNNAFLGVFAGRYNTTGSKNTFVGRSAGLGNVIGSSNTLIGYLSNVEFDALTNSAAIGANSYVTQNNSLILGSVNGVNSATSSTLVGIGTTAPLSTLDVRVSASTLSVASISGRTSFASLVANNDGVGDLFTASSSGTTKFIIDRNGNLGIGGTAVSAANYISSTNFRVTNTGQLALVGGLTSDIDTLTATTLKIGATTANAITLGNNTVSALTFNVDSGGPGHFVFQKEGGAYTCSSTDKLTLNGSGQLVCDTDQTGGGSSVNWWNQLAGALSPVDVNNDFLIGGTATSTAKFSYTGIQSGQTIASISGQLIVMANNGWGGNATISGALTLGAFSNAVIQTTKNQALIIGGDTTGQITIAALNGTQNIRFSGYTTVGCTLKTDTTGLVTCGTDNSSAGGLPYIEQNNGLTYVGNLTTDFAIGGNSTASADFAFTGMNNGNTPTMIARGDIRIEQQTNTITPLTKRSQSTAGQIDSGGTTLIASVSSQVEFNGSLYVGTGLGAPGSGGAEVYRYDGGSNWTLVSQSPGQIDSGGTTGIASVSAMTVFNGNLYIGTSKTGGAEIYKYVGGSDWTRIGLAAGQLLTETAIDGITSMVVFNGSLYVGTEKRNLAEVYRYLGNNTFVEINTTAGTLSSGVTAADAVSSMVVYNGAMFIAARNSKATAVLKGPDSAAPTANAFIIASGTVGTVCSNTLQFEVYLTVYNGALYAATNSENTETGTLNAVRVCRYNTEADEDVPNTTWTNVTFANGQIRAGGTANINGIRSMTVYNGRLYIGTNEPGGAEIYQYVDGDNWISINNTPGTLVPAGTSGIDTVSTMISYNRSLFVGTSDYDAAEVYEYRNITDQSYALKFHAGVTQNGVSEVNGNTNDGSIWFMASVSGQLGSNTRNTGSFMFSHGLITATGAYDVAEDYPTRDDSLEAGDLVAIDPNEKSFVRKSQGVDDTFIVGVLSSNPALRLSQPDAFIDGARAVPVALAGRVPIKVSTQSGEIKTGDYLTSSSIPGVAMKATKSSAVIGQAMENYSGEGIGRVLSFIKSMTYNGSIAQNFANLDTSSPEFGVNVLDSLEAQTSDGTSNIITDRLIAGLEIITPSIVTKNLTADTINAKTIKADHIEGLEIYTNRLGSLADAVKSLEALTNTQNVLGSATSGALLTQSNTQEPQNSNPENTLTLSSLNVDGLATLSGDVSIKGNAFIDGVLNVLDLITTKNLIVTDFATFFGNVIFKKDVSFEGRPTFNSDTAGFAVVNKGEDRVEVRFDEEYNQTPIVTASIALEVFEDATKAAALENAILSGNISYVITKRSPKGFVIKLNKEASEDISFSWVSLSVKDAKTHSTNLNKNSVSNNPNASKSAAFQSILNQLNNSPGP